MTDPNAITIDIHSLIDVLDAILIALTMISVSVVVATIKYVSQK